MNLRFTVVAALLLAGLHAHAASEAGLMVAMEVQRDGLTLGKPSVWQPSGTAGEISMKNEFRLKLTPTLVEDKADVRFEVFATEDGVETRIGAPRIIAKVGDQASIAWVAPNGKNYKLSMLVSKREKPSK
jgi:hypothetical protein